jgi:hypothetical protein
MQFFDRLAQYFESIGAVLSGQSQAASVFPNASDIGDSREAIYMRFLEQHVPHWCEVERGGYLFSGDGLESGQIDLIVSAGSAPRYAFLKSHGGKSFRQVDGVIAAISIKSTIRLTDVSRILDDFSKIPQMQTQAKDVNPGIQNFDVSDFLMCAVYASKCDDLLSIASKVREHYSVNQDIPQNRRPSLIHVNGKGVIFRAARGSTYGEKELLIGEYYVIQTSANVFGLSYVANEVRKRVALIPHILFRMNNDLPGKLLESSGLPFDVFAPHGCKLTPATSAPHTPRP